MSEGSAAERAHRARSDAELIAWVDERDQLLGALPRAELRERRLIGRGTFILLFNSRGELCVHQRSAAKAVYPAYWDLAAGGMVDAGEAYRAAAERELAEELGVHGVPLTEHGRFLFDQHDNRLWCAVYSACWDGVITPQTEEIQRVAWLSPAALLAHQQQHRYCPDSLQAWALYQSANTRVS